MTNIRWRTSPTLGRSIIYTVPTKTSTDDAPLTAPLSNLSRVKWCSDFNYVGVIATYSGTLSLSAQTAGVAFNTSTVLFAHGQSGIPGVFGVFPNLLGSGVDVAIQGSVIVETDTLTSGLRILNLFADGTNVSIMDWGVSRQAPQGFISHSIPWTVYVSDKVF